MSNEVQAALVTALIGVPALLLATWLGGWMARRQARDVARETAKTEREQFAHERLWDARREIYTRLIADLVAWREAAEIVDYWFRDEDTSPEAYYASEAYTTHKRASVEAYRKVTTFYRANRLLVTEAVADRVEQMIRTISENDLADELPPEAAASALQIATESHDDVLRIALSELVPLRG